MMQEWNYSALPEGFTHFDDSDPNENYDTFGWYGWLLVEWKGQRYIASARAQYHDNDNPYWLWYLQEKVSQEDFNEMEFVAWKCDTKATRYSNQ